MNTSATVTHNAPVYMGMPDPADPSAILSVDVSGEIDSQTWALLEKAWASAVEKK